MTTALEIANRALMEMGTRSSIASFTEDSNEAININKIFDTVRRQVLKAARWNFNRKVESLVLLKEKTDAAWTVAQPEPPWLYSYERPIDCIHARHLVGGPRFQSGYDGDEQIQIILTDVADAILIYSIDQEDYTQWDELALQAYVSALGGLMVIPLSGELNLMRLLLEKANRALMGAREFDANEQLFIQQHTPDWLEARGGSQQPGIFFLAHSGPLFSVPNA